MVLRLPAACLASLAFIEQPALGFIALKNSPHHSIGVLPRRCHTHGATARYQSRLDLGQPSVELALLGLNITRGISVTKSRRGGGFVAGGPEQAIFRLHERRIRGLENTKSEYVTAYLACARSGDTGRALFLLRHAAKRGVPLLTVDVASAMRVVCKQGTGWRQALLLYEGFLELALEQARATTTPLEETQAGRADAVPVPLSGQRQQLHRLKDVAPGWEDVCQAALEACNIGGQWEAALKVLSVLRAGGGGAELSEAAYTEAIEVCGNGGAWDMVLLLVAEMSSDEIPMTAATFETALKAIHVFLQGCAATGAWSWALSLLRCMSTSTNGPNGIPLNAGHYLDALRSCAGVVDKPGGPKAQAAAKAALSLLQDVRENGWLVGQQGEDLVYCAMKTQAAARDAWGALALLDQDDGLPRSVMLRTGAMQACSGAGEWRAALSILEDMQAEGLRPNGAAYVAAMEACARGGVMDLALELLDRVLMFHPRDERIVTAAFHGAIKACGNGGQWEEATSLLQRMRQDSLAVVTSREYNAAIMACCRAQQSVAALTLLGDMSVESEHCSSDETSYVLVMRAFGREGRWRTVIDLMGSLKEEAGLVPTVSSYNVVIEALAKAGEWMKALEMLAEMKQERVRPTEFTYSRCMAACEKSGEWERTLLLLADMKEQEDLVPDSYIFSTAMMACSKAGRLDDVLGILQEMRDMSATSGPNLVLYNIAIGSCARARDWPRMLEEMDRMRREDIQPEESTFAAPLDTCGRTGNLPMALELLDRMRKDGIKPGVVPYGYVVAAACRAGERTSAALLLDEMEAAGHPPNERTYGVAALACREGNNADAAMDLLRRRQMQGLPPDSLILSCAVQACSNAGNMQRGLELITEMKSAGFSPDRAFYHSVIAGINASLAGRL
ncbi:unnamed protein product [Ectocarpus sp. 13 AM-2016]